MSSSISGSPLIRRTMDCQRQAARIRCAPTCWRCVACEQSWRAPWSPTPASARATRRSAARHVSSDPGGRDQTASRRWRTGFARCWVTTRRSLNRQALSWRSSWTTGCRWRASPRRPATGVSSRCRSGRSGAPPRCRTRRGSATRRPAPTAARRARARASAPHERKATRPTARTPSSCTASSPSSPGPTSSTSTAASRTTTRRRRRRPLTIRMNWAWPTSTSARRRASPSISIWRPRTWTASGCPARSCCPSGIIAAAAICRNRRACWRARAKALSRPSFRRSTRRPAGASPRSSGSSRRCGPSAAS